MKHEADAWIIAQWIGKMVSLNEQFLPIERCEFDDDGALHCFLSNGQKCRAFDLWRVGKNTYTLECD